ncbi:MAG: murein biosynthesis integral membrane protein MurJ, partial [Sphingomonadales bacterium]
YADRLTQLPLGLIGIGVGTAMLPSLSRQLGGGDQKAAMDTQNRAIELVLLLTLPATAALMVSSTPLIRALLQHGAFEMRDTIATAQALAAFSVGLPAYVLIRVLTPGFYARSDTRTPVRIALVAMLVNLGLNLVLIWPLAHVGLALTTAIAAWVNAGLLYWTLRRRDHFAIDDRLRRTSIRLFAATLAMTALLFFVLNPLVDPWTGRGVLERAVALSAMIVTAVVVYFGLVFALGAYSLGTLKAQFRRKR